MFLRRFIKNSVQNVNYAKFPIVYPNIQPEPPRDEDFDLLGVTKEVNNRELVMAFREKSIVVHPSVVISVGAQIEYDRLVKAYDRIVLFRMAQDGVPQPYTHVYYPPGTHTKMIREFIDENVFWTFHVHEQYNKFVLVFWVLFGIIHTMMQTTFLKNPDL
jgi:hypothetical protein